MKKNLKILIIGLGSIGQRHYENLLKLGYKDVWAYDIDMTKVRSKKLKVRKINTKTLEKFDTVFCM